MIRKIIFFTCLVLFAVSCSRNKEHDGILIAVSIPPQKWFVSQIAGDKADTILLVPPGQNPHNYEPTPRQIQNLADASAWILSGAEFEISLRPKIESLFPNLLIIDGTQGMQFRLLEAHYHDDDGDEHDCDDDHEHHYSRTHGHSDYELDRHTWLGREPAKVLASHIAAFLRSIDNVNEKYYLEQYENLVLLIDEEFEKLKIILAPLYGRSVFVYHPSFGYFLDEFGIHQEAVETGGKEPSPRQLSLLIDKMIKEQVTVIFVQTQFPVNAAKTIADAVGAQVLELDPLAEDWLLNIRIIGQTLQKAIP